MRRAAVGASARRRSRAGGCAVGRTLVVVLASLLTLAAGTSALAQEDDPDVATLNGPALTVPDASQDILHPFGPLDPLIVYAGDIASASGSGDPDSPGDKDWYSFVVPAGRSGSVDLLNLGGPCPDPEGTDNANLISVAVFAQEGVEGPAPRNTRRILRPGEAARLSASNGFSDDQGGRYYLVVSGTCAGITYRVHVGPADSISTDPGLYASSGPSASPVIVPELGVPRIRGGVAYEAQVAPPGRNPSFVVQLGPRTDEDPVLSVISGVSEACQDEPLHVLLDADVIDPDALNRISPNGIRGLPLQTGLATLTIDVAGGCVGLAYQVRVDPPSAVVSPAPPPPPLRFIRQTLTLRRAGRVYSGQLTARNPGACRVASRIVTLRSLDRRGRAVARVRASGRGRYRAVLGRGRPERVFAFVDTWRTGRVICTRARSRTVR